MSQENWQNTRKHMLACFKNPEKSLPLQVLLCRVGKKRECIKLMMLAGDYLIINFLPGGDPRLTNLPHGPRSGKPNFEEWPFPRPYVVQILEISLACITLCLTSVLWPVQATMYIEFHFASTWDPMAGSLDVLCRF